MEFYKDFIIDFIIESDIEYIKQYNRIEYGFVKNCICSSDLYLIFLDAKNIILNINSMKAFQRNLK